MANPTLEEINEMKRLQCILGGKAPPENISKPLMNTSNDSNEIIELSTTPSRKEIEQMSNFLKIMEGEIPNMIEKSRDDSTLREALMTKKIDNGIKIGSWEITTKLEEGVNSKSDTFYNVYNSETYQYIDGDLFIYESAHAIVRMLNNGFNVKDSEIRNIVELDQEYQRLRLKAMLEKYHWHKVKDTDHEWKQELFEAKFDSVKSKAMFLKERIKNINLSHK